MRWCWTARLNLLSVAVIAAYCILVWAIPAIEAQAQNRSQTRTAQQLSDHNSSDLAEIIKQGNELRADRDREQTDSALKALAETVNGRLDAQVKRLDALESDKRDRDAMMREINGGLAVGKWLGFAILSVLGMAWAAFLRFVCPQLKRFWQDWHRIMAVMDAHNSARREPRG